MGFAQEESYLPDGMEEVKKVARYFNIGRKDVPDGDYRIRIVQKAICGWTEFSSIEKKSYRYRPSHRPKKPKDPTQEIGRFWATYIWNYGTSCLEVAIFNQNSIIAGLEKLAANTEWGNFTGYDITITKNTKAKKYVLTPSPHKPMALEIQKALKEDPVRLEALYDGGNPWMDLDSNVDGVQMEVPF